jgi:uncharacterized protein (TIGR02284 family)
MHTMPLPPGALPDTDRTAPDLSALVAAHDRTVDALQGFDKMAESADPAFRPVVTDLLDLHRRHAAALASMLARYGADPQDGGTLMGQVNRAVVAVRAAFGGIDHDSVEQIADGEAHVLEAYEEAMNAGVTVEERQTLVALHGELAARVADLRRGV